MFSGISTYISLISLFSRSHSYSLTSLTSLAYRQRREFSLSIIFTEKFNLNINEADMKTRYSLTCALAFLSCLKIFGQDRIDGYLGIDLKFPVNNIGRQYGTGDYDISGRAQINQDIILGFSIWMIKDFGVSCGVGISSNTFIVDNQIKVSEFDLPTDYNGIRKFKASGIKPIIGVAYRKGRFKTGISISQLFLFKNHEKQKSYNDSGVIDFPNTFPFIVVALKEKTDPLTNSFVYIEGEGYVQYKIMKSLNLKISVQSTLFKESDTPYTLSITKFPEAHRMDVEVLKDFHLSTTYRTFNIGLFYLISA
ncbi:MAG: hypothetical protein IPP15_16735 [Saprospiraceae bacterium]|uniref:Uncharacterized protein n=1 Tax=Candidatus Opimibacter skivensis TaxID=2982028 RepID=A0A9D7SVQ2_9BACT|nr:hypothetical protein [Candidatus Opimibacter skivensis]